MHNAQVGRRRPWSARTLFTAYALATLLPVLALGLILTQLLRTQADDRGLAEGTAQARLIAQAAVAPLLDGDPTTSLAGGEYTRLERTVVAATREKQVLRLRLRDLDGRIVFPRTETSDDPVDDEALDAAHGKTVARLTRLNADEPDQDPGPRVVEVYLPITNVHTDARIGVLELYLPYDPIADTIAQGQRMVYLTLLAGLAALWVCLIAVTASVIRHLRRETRARAYLAEHDPLTGLPNRARMLQDVAVLLTSEAAPIAVAVVTVERFRQIGDALGPANADAVLAVLARRLRAAAPRDTRLARMEGGDFAIVTGADHAHDLFLSLRVALREPIEINDVPIAVDTTIGYAVSSAGDSSGADTLLAHAATARTAAQEASTNILAYSPEQEQHDAAALSLLAGVRSAIDDDELLLHFQPKYDIADGRLSSVEALVRWQHPTRGLLYPATFIEAVEETELIDDLTVWVLRQACRAATQLNPDVQVAVNVSARNLVQPDFVADVTRVIRSERVSASRIILEITETAVITDPRRAQRTLRQLRACGFAIAIDDFGAGQTSLSQLVAMPLDEIKIDRMFVGNMTDNPRSAAVVRAVIELGHSLGIAVTAEGVETQSVLSALQSMHCDVAQGFYLSHPMPLSDLLGLSPCAASAAPTPAVLTPSLSRRSGARARAPHRWART